MSTPAIGQRGPGGPETPIDPAVVQRASRWMARLWSGEASDEEQTACARWRAAHPDHERAWRRLQAFEDRLAGVPPEVASQALRQPAAPAAGARRRALQMLGLAAVAGGGAWAVRETDTWQAALAEHRTPTGEIRELSLPDGTRVVLSSASAIDVRFGTDERLLLLRAGEILVTTAPDPSAAARPFRVRCRQGTVQALGTRFTVRQAGEFSHVAVFEGAVAIRPAEAPHEAAHVAAGQGADFSASRVAPTGAVQESAAAWSRGVLVADTMRLDDFVAELARYRPGLLRCDPAVAGLRVSGVFSLRDTDRALHNLTLALPVSLSTRTRYWVTVQAR